MAVAAGELAGQAVVAAREQARAFDADPYEYTARLSNRIGAASFFIGILAWLGGGYLTNAAKAAAADEAVVAAGIGNVFANAAQAASWVESALAVLQWNVVSEFKAGDVDVNLYADGGATNDSAVVTGLELTIVTADGKPVGTLDHKSIPLSFQTNKIIGDYQNGAGVTAGLQDKVKYGVVAKVSWIWGSNGTPYSVTGAFSTVALGSQALVLTVLNAKPGAGTPELWTNSGNGQIQVTGTDPTQASTSGSSLGNQTVPNPVGQALGALAGVAVAASDLPKAVVVTAVSLPRMLYDGLIAVLGGGLGALLSTIGPPLVLLGIALMLLGYVIRAYARRLAARVELAMNARTAAWWNRFDKWWKTRAKLREVKSFKTTEASIELSNAEPEVVPPVVTAPEVVIATPPVIDAPVGGGASTKPTGAGGGEAPPPPVPSPDLPPPPPPPTGPQPGDVVAPMERIHTPAPPGALPAEVATVDVRKAPVRRRRHETRMTGDQILDLARKKEAAA